MAKETIKANLKNSDKVKLVYNGRQVEMTIEEFFKAVPTGNIVISDTPGPSTSGIYSGSGYLPAHVTVNGLAGYDLYFTAIADFKIFANKFLLEHGTLNLTSGNYEGQIIQNTLTDNQSYTLPNNSGQFALEPVGTKKYKCLLSQNAPISSQTSGTFIVGMIITVIDYSTMSDLGGGDNFSNWNLISGSHNTTGAIYQVTTPSPTRWDFGSDLSYDGSPYIVSTDVNGDFAPFVNTLGETPTLSRGGAGFFSVVSTGLFDIEKTSYSIMTNRYATDIPIYSVESVDINTLSISTFDAQVGVTLKDDMLYYTPFEIEVYP